MNNRKKYGIFFVCVILFFLFSTKQIPFAQEVGEVVINGVVVMRFFGNNAEDLRTMVKEITDRLEDIINKGASVDNITVRNLNGQKGIFWGKTLICVVDAFQAKINNTTPERLASKWRLNLISACREKPLWTSVKMLVLPVGGEKRFIVKGGGKGKLQLIYDSAFLVVRDDSKSGEICVTAKSAANSMIAIRKGSSRGMVRVCVKDWAGKILPPVERFVTGNPTPPDVQLEAVLSGINEGVLVMPGSQVYLKENPRIETSLKQGYEREVKIPVLIEGRGYFPVEGFVRVLLKNRVLSIKEPSLLMVSNRPETLEEDGILFQGKFSQEKSARLLYSHKNVSSGKRRLWITLKNLDSDPVKLFVSKAAAGPDKFEIQTGHKAAMRYLENLKCGAGYILALPSRREVVLDEYDMLPQHTVSGLCDFHVLEGKEIEVEVKTSGNPSKKNNLKIIQEPFDPFKIHPHGIFLSSVVEIEKKFSVSQKDISIEVGKWPWLIDGTTGEPNTGNYGVLYKIKIYILNDTRDYTRITVAFIPRNGISMGSILIDGALFETSILRQDECASIMAINLAPGENRKVEMVTFPEAGSCYPVNIKIGLSKEEELTEK